MIRTNFIFELNGKKVGNQTMCIGEGTHFKKMLEGSFRMKGVLLPKKSKDGVEIEVLPKIITTETKEIGDFFIDFFKLTGALSLVYNLKLSKLRKEINSLNRFHLSIIQNILNIGDLYEYEDHKKMYELIHILKFLCSYENFEGFVSKMQHLFQYCEMYQVLEVFDKVYSVSIDIFSDVNSFLNPSLHNICMLLFNELENIDRYKHLKKLFPMNYAYVATFFIEKFDELLMFFEDNGVKKKHLCVAQRITDNIQRKILDYEQFICIINNGLSSNKKLPMWMNANEETKRIQNLSHDEMSEFIKLDVPSMFLFVKNYRLFYEYSVGLKKLEIKTTLGEKWLQLIVNEFSIRKVNKSSTKKSMNEYLDISEKFEPDINREKNLCRLITLFKFGKIDIHFLLKNG